MDRIRGMYKNVCRERERSECYNKETRERGRRQKVIQTFSFQKGLWRRIICKKIPRGFQTRTFIIIYKIYQNERERILLFFFKSAVSRTDDEFFFSIFCLFFFSTFNNADVVIILLRRYRSISFVFAICHDHR